MCSELVWVSNSFFFFFFFRLRNERQKPRLTLLHTYSIYYSIFVQLLRISQPLILQFPIKKRKKTYSTLENFFRFWLHFSVYFANKSFQVLKLVNCLSYPELRIYLWTWLSLCLSIFTTTWQEKAYFLYPVFLFLQWFSACERLYNGRMHTLFLVKICHKVRVFSLFKYLLLYSSLCSPHP